MRLLLASLLGLSLFAGEATPAYDTTLRSLSHERLPRWLLLSGEFRTRLEGRTGFNYTPENDDAYSLVRTRFNVELNPVPRFGAVVQLQDARSPGFDATRPQATMRNPLDLRQAYLRFGGPKDKFKFTAGRQLLNFGAQRLVGSLDWTNTSRAYDALRAEFGTADTHLDLFASSVVVNDPTRRIDHHRQGANLHGAYATFKKLVPHSSFEPYLLWKTGHLSIWTAGLRLAAAPGTPGLHNFDYQAEFARQSGHVSPTLDHRAQAGYGILGYTFAHAPWHPRLSGEYSYAAGDPNPGQGPHRTFDQLFPTNHLFYGVTDPSGWQNMKMSRMGLDAKPRKTLQVNADYRWLGLDSPHDALYDVTGKAAVKPLAGNTATRVGTELDLTATWTASRQWRLGAGVGHLFAGEFLKRNTTKGSGQTFPYLFAQYSF